MPSGRRRKTRPVAANDPQEAGRRLRDLILSDLMTRRLWGVPEPVTPEELRAHANRSVDIILMTFGERC